MSSICDVVSQLGLSVPERGLGVLKQTQAGLCLHLELMEVCALLTTKEGKVRPTVEVSVGWNSVCVRQIRTLKKFQPFE